MPTNHLHNRYATVRVCVCMFVYVCVCICMFVYMCLCVCRNYDNWTPLDLAALKGWTKTCSVLLNNDAPVDPIDKNKVPYIFTYKTLLFKLRRPSAPYKLMRLLSVQNRYTIACGMKYI
jgi:hypothetical protein